MGEVTTATIATTPRNRTPKYSNHLSVHQWIRSAIHASQQLTSPIVSYLWNFRHRLVRYYWYIDRVNETSGTTGARGWSYGQCCLSADPLNNHDFAHAPCEYLSLSFRDGDAWKKCYTLLRLFPCGKGLRYITLAFSSRLWGRCCSGHSIRLAPAGRFESTRDVATKNHKTHEANSHVLWCHHVIGAG